MDEPINFVYEDTDSYENEISELYSYNEESEFFSNRNAFEESMEDCGLPLTWKHMVPEQQSRAINYLMTTLEVSCRNTRIKSSRALAYLIQGNFGECLSLEEQAMNSRENVFILYKQGIFHAFVQQLLIESDTSQTNNDDQQQSANIFTSSQTFCDSSELRLILSVLYTITETMYHAKESESEEQLEMRQQFIQELKCPINSGDEILSIILFQMLNNFCSGSAPHYPVRKITLLLWKIILITLGGTQTLKELKEGNRREINLEPSPDDTQDITKNMRPCSPPLLPDGQTKARTALSGGFINSKRKVFKQTAFDDAVFAYAKECLLSSLAELNQPDMDNENGSEENRDYDNHEALNDSREFDRYGTETDDAACIITMDDMRRLDEEEEAEERAQRLESGEFASDSGITDPDDEKISRDSIETLTETTPDLKDEVVMKNLENIEDFDSSIESAVIDKTSAEKTHSNSLKLGTDDVAHDGSKSDVTTTYKGLPWAPKVRKADLSQHLSSIRQKFLGYTLQNDLKTTLGLPDPIIEGINVLKKHLYVSLSEVHLEREETIEKYPLTHKDLDLQYRDMPSEKLYAALLPKLPQYMISLLKILLAASTSSKNKSERSESINIMSEINFESVTPSSTMIQTMKMNADANRHKEVIIKAVSAILILLLKHFKINHVYQFEYISQQLMFANCIPLILKFLSQDIHSYILSSKSNISAIDFPACVIGEQPELTTEAIELCSFQPYSWRNMFSCINLVRILNKLTKWKHSRIMMLVVFKSAPTLTKALSVRHSMFQLYVLKLLKVQLKFLGRQWKKNNMKLISAIYQKVRHRLTDDWAYSNDNEARPWDFQAEEFTLQADINKFHQRRYHNILNPTNMKTCNSLIFNHSDKFGGFDECGTDEDYDFGLEDFSQISPQFEKNYERWLENEVFQRNIDWNKLLES